MITNRLLDSYLFRVSLLTLLYFFTALLGVQMGAVTHTISVIWPASGLALAALLLYGKNLWPGIALGAFLATWLTNGSLIFALSTAVSNPLETLLAVFLLNRFVGKYIRFNLIRDTLGLAFLAAFLSPIITAVLGTTGLVLSGNLFWDEFGSTWWAWWLGDALGIMVVAPFLLTWAYYPQITWTRKQWSEIILHLAFLAAASLLAFANLLPTAISLIILAYILFPLVGWVSIKFGPREATTATLLAAVIAIWGTAQGHGPLVQESSLQTMLYLWAYINIVAVVTLFMSSTTNERQQAEERFRKAFHTSPDSINLNRLADGVYIDINDGFTQITGYTRQDVIGKSSLEVNIWADPADRARLVAGLQANGYVRGLEAQFHMKGGITITGLMSARVIEIDGEACILSVTRDISHRKETEIALRRSEERYRMIFQHSPLGIFQFDAGGVIVDCNDKFVDVIGSSRERLIGFDMLHRLRDKDMQTSVRQALDGRISRYEGDYRSVTADKVTPVRVICSPLSDDQGVIAGGIGIVEDVTEQRRVEAAMRQAQKMESLGVLAGGVAHDFNNLLVAILGQASIAKMHLSPDHPAFPAVEKSTRAAEQAAELTRQLLAYSGQGQFEIKAIDLNALITENLHLLRVAVPTQVELRPELTTALPLIDGDVGQIQQVVMNLVLNAAEAIGESVGQVVVRTGVEAVNETGVRVRRQMGDPLLPGNYVTLTVQDDGAGMDTATMSRIFDPFFTTKFTGRGLGLAAVQGIVHGHSGALFVESQVNEGTTFSVYFPISQETAVPPKQLPPQLASDKDGGVVLVIDDEIWVREAAVDILEMAGLTAVTADSGPNGIALYRERRAEINLIILDLSMPEMDGETTLRLLKQINPEVCVLISSGYSQWEVVPRFAELGVAGFLQKPYGVAQFLQAVRQHLP